MTSFNKLFGIIYFGSHFLLKRIQLLIVSLFFLGSTYIFGLGTQFLSIPGTALELAIGINPVLDGGSFSNPAAPILNKSNPDLFFSHGFLLAGVTGSTIRFSRGFTYGTGGLQIRYAGLNDLEFRTSTPADNSLENFGAYGVSFGGFYNRVLGNTRYGMALQAVSFQIYNESSNGYAVNFGLIRKFRKNFTFGASLLNVGSMSLLSKESPSLPVRILGGFSYRFIQKDWENKIFLSAENSSMVSGMIFRIGNEFSWKQLVIQMGSQFSQKVSSVSGGFGFRLGIYRFQYGVQVGSQNLGISQMLDFSIRLP